MNPFNGIQFIPGVGHVETRNPDAAASALGHLGDDASVMMISGLGQESESAIIDPRARQVGSSSQVLSMGVRDPFNLNWPWWVWLLLGAGLLVAGAYLFRNLKKG